MVHFNRRSVYPGTLLYKFCTSLCSCTDGYLKVYLKGQETTDSYDKFDYEMCADDNNNKPSPSVVVSDGPRLVIVFSSGEKAGRGFKASYTFETGEQCNLKAKKGVAKGRFLQSTGYLARRRPTAVARSPTEARAKSEGNLIRPDTRRTIRATRTARICSSRLRTNRSRSCSITSRFAPIPPTLQLAPMGECPNFFLIRENCPRYAKLNILL